MAQNFSFPLEDIFCLHDPLKAVKEKLFEP